MKLLLSHLIGLQASERGGLAAYRDMPVVSLHLAPKTSTRNNWIQFQKGKRDSRHTILVPVPSSDTASLSSGSTADTRGSTHVTLEVCIREALEAAPAVLGRFSLSDSVKRLQSWDDLDPGILDIVIDCVASYVQTTTNHTIKHALPIHVPRLMSFFGSLAHMMPDAEKLYDFLKWLFPAIFSMYRNQEIPALFGQPRSRTFLRRCLPHGCAFLPRLASLYSRDWCFFDAASRFPETFRSQASFNFWKVVLDSTLFAKAAFPALPTTIVERKTAEGARAFGRAQAPLHVDDAEVIRQRCLEIVGQVGLKYIERRYRSQIERERLLEEEVLYFQAQCLEEIASDRQVSRVQRHAADADYYDVQRQISLVERKYSKLRLWKMASVAGSWNLFSELRGEFFSLTDYCVRAGSFGGALGSKRKDGGQFGAVNHLFRREKPRTVVGWSSVSFRDRSYEEYLDSEPLMFSTDVDRRIWDSCDYDNPDLLLFSYPILAFTPEFLSADVERLLHSAYMRRPECKFIGISEPMKVRTVAVSDPEVYFLAAHLQPLLYDFVSQHPTFKLTSRPVDVGVVSRVMSFSDAPYFLSGDYKGATNDLHQCVTRPLFEALSSVFDLSDEWKSVFENTLFNHRIIVEDPEGELEDEVYAQQRGQFMGSPVSFPILCLANAVACDLAGLPGHLHRSPILINGDDVVVRCDEGYYRRWSQVTKMCGLEPSIGKCYFSSSFLTINSVLFENYGPVWCPARILRWGSLRPYADDVGLDKVLGSDDHVDAGISGICRAFFQSYQRKGADDPIDPCAFLADSFWSAHKTTCRRLVEGGFIIHPSLPREMFGLGFSPDFSATVFGESLALDPRHVTAGLWARDHMSYVKEDMLRVLPRLPNAPRVRSSAEKSHVLTPCAGMVNLWTWSEVAECKPRNRWSIRRLLRSAYRYSEAGRLGSDIRANWPVFVDDLCRHPHVLSFQRIDTFSCAGLFFSFRSQD